MLPLYSGTSPLKNRTGPSKRAARNGFSKETLAMSSSMRRWSAGGLLVMLLLSPRLVLAGEPDRTKLAGIPERMQQFVDEKIIAGAVTLVGTHDQIVSLVSVGSQVLESNTPMRPDTLFRIASMTKPIT